MLRTDLRRETLMKVMQNMITLMGLCRRTSNSQSLGGDLGKGKLIEWCVEW